MGHLFRLGIYLTLVLPDGQIGCAVDPAGGSAATTCLNSGS